MEHKPVDIPLSHQVQSGRIPEYTYPAMDRIGRYFRFRVNRTEINLRYP